MADGRNYGQALLDPSVIYVKLIAALQQNGVGPHYAVHVTGHGWRKLMRLEQPFVYQITSVREPLPVFKFIAEHGPVSEREMYATFNMCVGFAIYVAPEQSQQCLALAKEAGYDAWIAGRVIKDGNRKAVEIQPLGLTYDAASLQVR